MSGTSSTAAGQQMPLDGRSAAGQAGADRLGTGASQHEDGPTAATAALTQALDGRTPRAGDLVLVMADVGYDERALMAAVVEAAAPAQVVGVSAMGAFSTTSPGAQLCVVTYVPAGDCVLAVGSGRQARGDLYASSGQATRAAKARLEAVDDGVERPYGALLLLSDGLGGDQRETVRGAYEVAGATVPLVGGAAGDNLNILRTWQAAQGRTFSGGVVAVWVASPRPLGVGIDHGWQPVSRPLQITRASGTLVEEIDGRPALEAYLEARGEAGIREVDTFAGSVLDRPFGLPNVDGGYDVRHIMDRNEHGLVMFGHVHDQAIVRLLAADHESLLTGAKRAVVAATSQLSGPTRGALVFSCAARLQLLGPRVDEEVRTISEALAGAPAGGFFTYGEFARVTGSTGFHNASVAVLAL